MHSPKYCDYSQLWIDTQSTFVVLTILSTLYHVFLIIGIVMSLVEKMGHPIITFILTIQTLYPGIVRAVVNNQTLLNVRVSLYLCTTSIITNVTIAIVIVINFYESDLGTYVSQDRITNIAIYFVLDIIIMVVLDIIQLVLLEIQILPRVKNTDIILKTTEMDKIIGTQLVSVVDDLISDSKHVQLKDRIFETLSLHYAGKSIHKHDGSTKNKSFDTMGITLRTNSNNKPKSNTKHEKEKLRKSTTKSKKQSGLREFSILEISHPIIAYVLFRNIDTAKSQNTFTESLGSGDSIHTDTKVNTLNNNSINV